MTCTYTRYGLTVIYQYMSMWIIRKWKKVKVSFHFYNNKNDTSRYYKSMNNYPTFILSDGLIHMNDANLNIITK